jgi:hypothetical protein
MKVRVLYKGEMMASNRRAIKAGCRAIEPEYIEQLPDDLRHPIFFTLPWERHGWVRCQVGTATSPTADNYMPVWLDVPRDIYDHLSVIEVPVDEEERLSKK